ncbi:MAG TPA: hypothetical protein PKD32_11410 [Saprospiraceae bacterium]|nr:hypothetical protein [Saprospiraceae bacterium]
MNNSLYNDIVDFVMTVKKLEYSLYSSCKTLNTGNIFEEYYHSKTIPRNGEFEYDGQIVQYYFHGLGIDFITERRRYHYNYHGCNKGFGVYFTPLSIYGYDFKMTAEIQIEFDRLIQHNKITQWMPEIPSSKEFYLV